MSDAAELHRNYPTGSMQQEREPQVGQQQRERGLALRWIRTLRPTQQQGGVILGQEREPGLALRAKNLVKTLLDHYGYEFRRPLATYDRATRKIIEQVRPFTQTSPESIFAIKNAVEYVIQNDIPGDIVECGVWKGGGMMVAALSLLNLRATRRLHLFDTFEGMTAPTSMDRDLWGRSQENYVGAMLAPLEEVKANLRSTGYDEHLITYVKGPVEETLPTHAPARIAVLRLDTDWYESTRHELQHLFCRLSGGGVLIIDDYGHFEGARKATDEFIAARGVHLLLNRIDYTARICVKPLAP